MKNNILKIFLKSPEERSISELLMVIGFWRNCDLQEFKFAWHLQNVLKINKQ